LIRLHTGNFDFTHAQNAGQDLRFVSADDAGQLNHHIEKIDPLAEIAYVWVRVPRLPGGSNQEFIWLYHGNEDAVAGQDTGNTYDADQAAVFHFNETQGLPRDATALGNHAAEFSGGQGFPAVIGNGVVLNGIGDRMRLPAAPSLAFSEGFTFSAWVRFANPQADAHLVSIAGENGTLTVGIDGLQPYTRLQTPDAAEVEAAAPEQSLPPNTWQHLAVTAAPRGALVLYLNGAEVARTPLPGPLPEFSGDVLIGAAADGEHAYAGEIDELQFSKVARSGGWIQAAVASQGAEAALYRIGVEVIGGGAGGLPVFYLPTIAKNITLDGWVVIGILILLMVTSWMIMLTKSFFIWVVGRENSRFYERYNAQANPTGLQNDASDEEFQNASIYRLYKAGCLALRPWLQSDEGEEKSARVPARGMENFKAALDRQYLQESKRINAFLVLLTIAITGGPFLGLLGTVWGVMNTFAAMAEAGEANIMAIAPGVASALSTTVFGLIVAIPALFGYNFITSKIKNITADMNVFMDDFTLKVEQAHRPE
jgi:biopolymer transport protein ExbB